MYVWPCSQKPAFSHNELPVEDFHLKFCVRIVSPHHAYYLHHVFIFPAVLISYYMRKRKVEVRDYAVVCVLSYLTFHRFPLTRSPLSHILGSSLRIHELIYKEHQWLSTHSARIARSLTTYIYLYILSKNTIWLEVNFPTLSLFSYLQLRVAFYRK